jgi:hypothetical protein
MLCYHNRKKVNGHIMTVDLSLQQYLRSWNESLRKEKYSWPSRRELRAELENTVGHLIPLRKLDEQEINTLSGGRPLVGVDGSVYTLGGNYPFTVTAFQAVAKSTVAFDRTDKVVRSSLYSPLDREDRDALRSFMEQQEDGLTEDAAFSRYRDRQMALLEIEAATIAVERFRPFLVLLDGQFSRYQKDEELFDKWHAFCQRVQACETLVVGVVEEVGTMKLKKFLSQPLQDRLITGHDREILFGLFETGEALLPHEEVEIKHDAYVAFARLSDHPQAIACNFLYEQVDRVQDLMYLLYTLTPKKGRGIPLWLDLVDVEARITKKEWELLVQSTLDKDMYERFLRPQRERRDY